MARFLDCSTTIISAYFSEWGKNEDLVISRKKIKNCVNWPGFEDATVILDVLIKLIIYKIHVIQKPFYGPTQKRKLNIDILHSIGIGWDGKCQAAVADDNQM
ncbi:hypothetical protein ACTXT7_010366 [Hymenolepis weldensis]